MFNVKFSLFIGIYTSALSCIVRRPDEVCASHTKRVGDNKTILPLKKFAEVLLTGLFLKYSLQPLDRQCRKAAHWKRMDQRGNK